MVFPNIYVTLVFDILHIYFALWAFNGILLLLSFQKEKQSRKLSHLATQVTCPWKPFFGPWEVGSEVGWPPEKAETWWGWSLLAAEQVLLETCALSPPSPGRLFFLPPEGVQSSLVSGRASSLNPKAWCSLGVTLSCSHFLPTLDTPEEAAVLPSRAVSQAAVFTPGLVVPTVFLAVSDTFLSLSKCVGIAPGCLYLPLRRA